MVEVGGCLVPVDFHILEMSGNSHMSLLFGSTFHETVGAIIEYPKTRVFFSKIKKRVFYPAVPTGNSHYVTVPNGEKLVLGTGDDKEKPQDF